MGDGNGKRGRGRTGASSIAPGYEGPEVLSALLSRAGCPLSAGEVADRFASAQAEGRERAQAIPPLFPREPRFGSTDDARRLYQNLFGLWARVEAGQGAGEGAAARGPARAAEPAPAEAPPLPPRGSASGDRLPPALVEAVWQHLAALPPREARSLRHRFESSQPDLGAWLAAVELPESGAAAAMDLVLESWAMLDQAFGDRVGCASWKELSALAQEPPPLEADQPALAAYAAEQLDNLADEDDAFGPEERAQVERVLAAAVAALARTLE